MLPVNIVPPVYHSPISVVQNRKELLALCMRARCNDIKLVDMETKQVTPLLKFPTDPPVQYVFWTRQRFVYCFP